MLVSVPAAGSMRFRGLQVWDGSEFQGDSAFWDDMEAEEGSWNCVLAVLVSCYETLK